MLWRQTIVLKGETMRIAGLRGLLCLCVLAATTAHASPVTFSFSGSVTDDPFTLSSFGAPITGTYTFDSTAADAIPAPGTGSYPSVAPAFGFTANVDGTAYSIFGSLTINTANDIGVDQYGAITTDAVLTLELFFQDSSQTALSSDALPLLPPAIGAFDFRQFRLFSPDAEFLGTVDTLVCSAGCGAQRASEPATLWLFSVALVSFALRRFRAS